MISNLLICVLDIFKYYIISKYVLGLSDRKQKIYVLMEFLLIVAFSTYLSYSDSNPLFVFLLFVYVEMLMLFKENKVKTFLISIGMVFFVGMIDDMFILVVRLMSIKYDLNYEFVKSIASIVSMIFIGLIVFLIKKRIGESSLEVSKGFLLYFILITFASGMLTAILDTYLESVDKSGTYILVLICTMIMLANTVAVSFLAVSNNVYKQRDLINKKYQKAQEMYYLTIKEKYDSVRSVKHDMVEHLISIRELNESGKQRELNEYIEEIERNIHEYKLKYSVKNEVVDALLNHTLYEADKENITVEVEGELQEKCHIEIYDLCVIFSNLLNNAMDAAKVSDDKKIKLRVRQETGLSIYIENSYKGERIKKKEGFASTKLYDGTHGYGLKNVKNSVKKYGGNVMEHLDENKFYVSIYIP